MGELLYTIIAGVEWTEALQILVLIFLLWLVRRLGIANGGVEKRIRDTIVEELRKQDDRIEKRVSRQAPTPETLENLKSGEYPSGLFRPPLR